MYCKHCGEQMNENQAICLKCGVPAGKGKNFCPNCGNAVAEEAVICVKCGVSLSGNPINDTSANLKGIEHRSIIIAIILSIVTCGIYGIYWFICLTNDMNKASGRANDTSGGTAFLLSIVTCGIYTFFWAYRLGEKRDIVAGEKGYSSIIYLLLTMVGFGIVAYCLAQDAINKAIENK